MVQNKTINEQLDATSRSYEWEIKNTPSKSKKESWKIREKIINILNDMDIELLFTEIKDKQGKKFELSDEFMELYNIFWDYVKDRLIKQLQKEINSQTEQNSDKEVAQPYSKSDKTTKEIGGMK